MILCNKILSTIPNTRHLKRYFNKTMIERSKRLEDSNGMDIWSIFTPLSIQHQSSQGICLVKVFFLNSYHSGFPNFPAEDFVKRNACSSILENYNQYSPTNGWPHLRDVLAHYYSPMLKRKISPDEEIMISQGANHGIFLTLQAYLNTGDEVLVFEPYFDIYKYQIEILGAKMIPIRLNFPKDHALDKHFSANSMEFDVDDIHKACKRSKIKAIIMNSPHNPTGKVFSVPELLSIAECAVKYNLLVISDEVYENMCYDECFTRIATLPGMWERTLTVSSASKTFGVTGWRVGWVVGPSYLIKNIVRANAKTVFCVNTPMQEAVAKSFEESLTDDYFGRLRDQYIKRRNFLSSTFKDLGFSVIEPHGTFFLLVDFSNLAKSIHLESYDYKEDPDYHFCIWLTKEIGVTGIPLSAFYEKENKSGVSNIVRFCFAKDHDTLLKARERLDGLKKYL